MNLAEKIEKIKKEPEHIRLRYIWFCVFISMFFIIMLWIFSLQIGNTEKRSETSDVLDLDSLGSRIEQERETLKEINENIKNSSDEIISQNSESKIDENFEENQTIKNTQESMVEKDAPLSFPVK
ncbi:MAG: hypothetical protein ACD_15C00066G0006 [uncultured bacterium]|nr:MAG: hypothetical protein ACD_15C00066G0006 [uncultured bacterium]HCU70792.1 hypothetical protein [Candidatus Moranbacteria bacterium]